MFRAILRQELQETFSKLTLLSALVVLTILVLLSAYVQAHYYQRVVEDYALRQKIHQAENSSQTAVLTRPLPPLLPFFNGIYDSLPEEFRLRSESVTTLPLSGDLMPLDWLFPKIDLSFVIGVLMTLLTVLFAHDTIAGDREQGTLKLILASPVRRGTVLAAKLTGIILTMAIFLVYVVLLYIAVVVGFSRGTVSFSIDSLSVLAISTLVALLMLMVAAALGAAIAASIRRSLLSLSISASIWIVAILIWPSLGPYIASSIKAVPTWEASQREIALKEGELIQAELAEQRKTAADLHALGIGVEVAWQRYLDVRRNWVKRRNEEIGRLVNRQKKEIRDQYFFARRISAFSPYVAFKEVLGSLCGTGLDSYDEFLASVERVGEREFLPSSFDLLSRQKPWLDPAKPDSQVYLRPLQTPAITLYRRLTAVAWPLGILIAEVSLLVLISIFSFDRYDVR
jgi:ABC-type transport system involved in multi-copper enzyme maturation permease subunit